MLRMQCKYTQTNANDRTESSECVPERVHLFVILSLLRCAVQQKFSEGEYTLI